MFKTTLNTRRKTTNLNFRNRTFIEILLNNAITNSTNKINDKKIRLLIKKVEIVRRIKKIIFEIGFNSCMNEFPGM